MQRSFGKPSFKRFGNGNSYTQRAQGQKSFQQQAPRPKFSSTPEQKADYGKTVKELTATYFMRGLRLALLPGGFPMCYAVGRALVTDYDVWMDFKNACEAKAQAAAKIEVYDAATAPFTWGVRPISPVRLHPLTAPETCYWIWDFVLLNIAPYQPARVALAKAIRATNSQFVPEIVGAAKAGEWPSDEALVWFASLVSTDTAITPGQLAETFKEEPDGTDEFVNLGLLQTTPEKAAARAAKARETAARMEMIGTDAEDEPPAAPKQQGGFISDDDGVDEDGI